MYLLWPVDLVDGDPSRCGQSARTAVHSLWRTGRCTDYKPILPDQSHSMIPVSSLDFDWSLVAGFSGIVFKKILGFKWILTAQLPNVQGFLKALFSNVQGFICRIPAE